MSKRSPEDGDRVECIGPDLGERDLPRGYGYLRRGALGWVINVGGSGVSRMEPEEFRLIDDQGQP